MTLKYEILKRLVRIINIKKMWCGMSTEELLEKRRRQNAKNRIPDLKDDAFEISRIEVMGCPVLKLIHREKTDRQPVSDRRRHDRVPEARCGQEIPIAADRLPGISFLRVGDE